MKLLAIVSNSLRVLMRVPIWLAFTLLAPLLFTLILGVAQGGSTGDDTRVNVWVANLDGKPIANEVVAQLGTSTLLKVSGDSNANEDEARNALKNRDVDAVLIVPSDFSTKVQAGQKGDVRFLINPANANKPVIEQEIIMILTRVTGSYDVASSATQQAEKMQPFASAADKATYYSTRQSDALKSLNDPMVKINLVQAGSSAGSVGTVSKPSGMRGFNRSSAGSAIQWVITGAMSLAGYIVLERKNGTLRRLMVTPISRHSILLGLMLLAFVIAVMQVAVVILFGSALGANWGNDIAALALTIGCYALSMSGLTILFASIARSQEQAIGLGVAIANIAAPLAGAWFPRELIPEPMLWAGKLLPSGWAMEALSGIMGQNWHLPQVLLPCLVMVGFAVLFLGIGIVRFKYE